MNEPMIVLNISSDEVKFAEIAEENGIKVFRRLSHFRSSPDNPIHATEVIKKLMEDGTSRNKKALLVINSEDLDYKDFSFPFGSPKKVSGAIQFEISSEYPPDEYIVEDRKSVV